MAPPSSIYIIPPYLLSTHEGGQLRKKLARINERLSACNVITKDSPYFSNIPLETDLDDEKGDFAFSNDPILHSIIKEKVLYKLAIIGVLGNNPMESIAYEDKYVHEMFNIFKSRLLEAESGNSNVSDEGNSDTSKENASKSPFSIFNSTRVGEVNFRGLCDVSNLDEYQAYYRMTLKELLSLANNHTKPGSGHCLSSIRLDKNTYFGYPLPMSWAPLIHSKYWTFLKERCDLKINADDGYSTITLHSGKTLTQPNDKDLSNARFYNFITDQPIISSFGILYYELEIEQVATEATSFKTLIAMNDPSVSSNSTLEVLAGFTKRFVTYDAMKSPSNSTNQLCTIDMEKIKHDVHHNESLEGFSSTDLNLFLNTRPGAEALGRAQISNMNRRLSTIGRAQQQELDSGKIDVGIPFRTRMVEDTPRHRVYKTDVVGCGVNFVNKTIFITLNGVLAKVIGEKEITSTHGGSNDLFEVPNSHDPTIEIYPMLGFKLNELERVLSVDSVSTAKITTNFGFKEFKFNIKSYVNHFRRENQKAICMSLLEKIRLSHSKLNESNDLSDTETALLHVNDDSQLLNKLIKGYLVHQGYIKTFNALNSDLTTSTSNTINGNENDEKDLILIASHAKNRQHIKTLMQSHQFDEVLKFLDQHYHHEFFDSTLGTDTVFKIKWLDYMISLKVYLDRRLKLHDNFEFEFKESEQEMLRKIITKRNSLLEEYKSEHLQDKVSQLSPLLIVRLKQDLDKLPKVKKIIGNHALHFQKTLASVNAVILKSAGFTNTSSLERIFNQVEQNVTSLIRLDRDDKFKLVNLEADYMGQNS